MRWGVWVFVIVLIGSTCALAENADTRDRRHRAARAFHDGILLVHAKSQLDSTADGFRQDPYFYYFTGLQNTVGALFAIDGKSGESWLFLPSKPPFAKRGLQPEVAPGVEAVKQLGIEHVVDWSELKGFLARQASHPLACVGSEEARLRASLRPPLKLHVHISRMQLSRRLTAVETQLRELIQRG